jgi:hypothetical protein
MKEGGEFFPPPYFLSAQQFSINSPMEISKKLN